MARKERVPKKNQYYHFFDDGKIRLTRLENIKCVNVVSFEDAQNIIFEGKSLIEVWRKEVEEHKCTNNFIVIPNENGYWCLSPVTDKFVECILEVGDKEPVHLWFARHISGGWFSFTGGLWDGLLDANGSRYKALVKEAIAYPEDYKEGYYEELMKYKI